MNSFKISLAQFSPHIGNVAANVQKMIELANEAKQQNSNIIVFPELSTIGYPAEDLLLRPSLTKRTAEAFAQLATVKDIVMVFGFVNQTENGHRYNSAAVMKDGQVLGIYNKQNLPNYSVFDEKRYFAEGHQHLVFEYLGHKFGVLICEDVWTLETVQQLAQLNVESILVLNASPYEVGKPQHRIVTLKELAKQLNVNIVLPRYSIFICIYGDKALNLNTSTSLVDESLNSISVPSFSILAVEKSLLYSLSVYLLTTFMYKRSFPSFARIMYPVGFIPFIPGSIASTLPSASIEMADGSGMT